MSRSFCHLPAFVLFLAWFCGVFVSCQGLAQSLVGERSGLRPSLYFESNAAVVRGRRHLRDRQLANGSWGNHPVITAMSILALAGADPGVVDDAWFTATERGVRYLVELQGDDGVISTAGSMQYPVYSTAVSVLAVSRVRNPAYDPVLIRARDYLIESQHWLDQASPDFGGFPGIVGGYADLLTTQWVLEALYITDRLAHRDAGDLERIYDRALLFIRRCQPAVEPDSERGLFFDSPRQLGAATTAVSPATPTNRFLRTAAGIKSLVYGRAMAEDPQLIAAVDWLYRRLADVDAFLDATRDAHYTSFFFVGRTLRVLERAGIPPYDTDAARGWRERIALELLRHQGGDGGWPPGDQAWWENHPDLVTAYAVLTLQGLLR